MGQNSFIIDTEKKTVVNNQYRNDTNKSVANKYNIETFVLNSADFGVPQSRPRAFVKIFKKGFKWTQPKPQPRISLKEAIGSLPSLESGQYSNLKWHYAKVHNEREILSMRYTPEGKSAMLNPVHFPKKENGMKIKGFHNTYKRMKWDFPSPARAMNSGNIGGHNNVHPGRKNKDGTYSDARVLTLRELFIVSSLPGDLDLPNWCTENFIRTVIGEAIPPLFCKKIIMEINK
jgi:DNA (cytosine-5)-methyltransferase 1